MAIKVSKFGGTSMADAAQFCKVKFIIQSDKDGNCGFALPAMDKSLLFPAVAADGALPRKTFSMGEANEKRYYIESRFIGK